MRVAIIGAGIGGITAAHELARAGHTVTVFERRQAVAAEGSFALPGLHAALAPLPWCLPGVPRRRLARWLAPGGSLALGGVGAWLLAPWSWQHWRADAAERATQRASALQALALLGEQRLQALQADLQPDVEAAQGVVLLWRQGRGLDRARRALEAHPLAPAPQWLDADACRRLEPHLNPALPLAGGLQLPGGAVANARQWAQHLKAAAQALGARFLLDTEVLRVQPGTPALLTTAPARVEAAGSAPRGAARGAEHAADVVVVSAGASSRSLLAQAGLRLPLRSLSTFSLTAPLALPEVHEHGGPRGAVLDVASGISIARMGERLRVGGVQAFGGAPQRQLAWAGGVLHRALAEHFPGGGLTWRAQTWAGARARVPDGAPLVGQVPLPGVWLHTGHGACGWSHALGSAALLAELVQGRAAAPELAWLGCGRFR